MNNNRNNRRRGRGNRNQGGGNQANRIDSRARGNAPQLLDKYKKLAQDAQHNGDRVQAEYYLQFADHYFRVIADNKARQDEARAKRDSDRDQSDDEDEDDGEDRRPSNRRPRAKRDDRDNRDNRGSDDNAEGPPKRSKRRAAEGNSIDDGDNPFAVSSGNDEEPRPSRPRTRKPRAAANGSAEIDASVLPPSLNDGDDRDAPPKRKAAPRRRKLTAEDDAEQAIG